MAKRFDPPADPLFRTLSVSKKTARKSQKSAGGQKTSGKKPAGEKSVPGAGAAAGRARRVGVWSLGGLLVAAAVAGAIAVAFDLTSPAAWLARYYEGKLATAGPLAAPILIEKLDALGEAGTKPLLAAAGAPSPLVAGPARRALHRRVDQWMTTRQGADVQAAARLAAALEQAAADYDLDASRWSYDLAERLARIKAPADRSANRARLIASCQAILRISGERIAAAAPTDPAKRLAGLPDDGLTAWSGSGIPAPRSQTVERLAARDDLFGGGAGDPPPLPAGLAPPTPHPAPLGLPALSPLPPEALPDDPVNGPNANQRGRGPAAGSEIDRPNPPRLLPHHLQRPASPDGSRPGQRVPRVDPPPDVQTGLDRPAAAFGNVPQGRQTLSHVEDLAVIRLLRSAHPPTRDAAEAELKRRGFEDRHLALARRLTDPDPARRQELATLLPRLVSLDPRPWLLALAEDEAPEVRKAAVGVIGAMGDRELHRATVAARRNEPDADVRDAVERIARALARLPQLQ